MLRTDLAAEFQKRGPWITKFVVEGQSYGGDYDAMNDPRLDQFFQGFPEAHTIMELGSFEGGHTLALARRPQVTRVLGVEGRAYNIERARFAQGLLNVANVEFKELNLEKQDLSRLGNFDAVYCVGLLYHLPRPWELVQKISRVTSHCFIWTHYTNQKDGLKKVNGFEGIFVPEHGLKDPLSGLSVNSFWPTLDSLRAMLTKAGYSTIQIIEDNAQHPHGPSVTLAASR